MLLEKERNEVVEYGKKLIDTGLTVGTFGNISVYNKEKNLMAISPSGMDYYKIEPKDVVVLDLDGNKIDGEEKPSSEYDMHRIFYQNRKDVNCVIHTHSTYSTTLACLGWKIPPLHYIVGYAGREVNCIPYVKFGTYELAKTAYEGMKDANAVLLGNHGLLVCGSAPQYTLDIVQQIEFAAELYYRTKAVGEPVLLTDEEMDEVIGAFANYRKK